MDRSTLRTQMAFFANDPNFTRFNPTQYNDAINRAQEQFSYDSEAYYKDASTLTVVTAQAEYSLPSDFWLEKVITHKGLRLTPVSIGSLLYENGDDWSDDSGTPIRYIIRPEEAKKKLVLYPIPEAADAGANLILTYYPIPASLTTDTQSPFASSALMVQFHMAVAAWGAALLLLGPDMTPETVAKRSELNAIYLKGVGVGKSKFGDSPREPWRVRGCKG